MSRARLKNSSLHENRPGKCTPCPSVHVRFRCAPHMLCRTTSGCRFSAAVPSPPEEHAAAAHAQRHKHSLTIKGPPTRGGPAPYLRSPRTRPTCGTRACGNRGLRTDT